MFKDVLYTHLHRFIHRFCQKNLIFRSFDYPHYGCLLFSIAKRESLTNPSADRENRTPTSSLARTRPTIKQYPQISLMQTACDSIYYFLIYEIGNRAVLVFRCPYAAPVVKWISSLPSKQLLGVRIPPGAPIKGRFSSDTMMHICR